MGFTRSIPDDDTPDHITISISRQWDDALCNGDTEKVLDLLNELNGPVCHKRLTIEQLNGLLKTLCEIHQDDESHTHNECDQDCDPNHEGNDEDEHDDLPTFTEEEYRSIAMELIQLGATEWCSFFPNTAEADQLYDTGHSGWYNGLGYSL